MGALENGFDFRALQALDIEQAGGFCGRGYNHAV
jgi:hypothetical protein